MILVTGGSGSGKSAFAEKLVCDRTGPDAEKTYLATMAAGSKEAAQRIARHRRQRAGQGFETVECQVNISSVTEKCRQTVLLEDLGNLLANEMFGTSDSSAEEGRCTQADDQETSADDGGRGGKDCADPPEDTESRKIGQAAERIFRQLQLLDIHCRLLVIVTDEIFSDGGDYEPETVRYMQQLGLLNRLVAGEASEVWEVICGIPVMRKACGS